MSFSALSLIPAAKTGTQGHVCFRHKADMSGSGLLPCNVSPEPHFASPKSLL